MEFPRQEYRSGLPFPSPGDLPDPGTEPGSSALQADSLPTEPPGKPVTDATTFKRNVPGLEVCEDLDGWEEGREGRLKREEICTYSYDLLVLPYPRIQYSIVKQFSSN